MRVKSTQEKCWRKIYKERGMDGMKCMHVTVIYSRARSTKSILTNNRDTDPEQLLRMKHKKVSINMNWKTENLLLIMKYNTGGDNKHNSMYFLLDNIVKMPKYKIILDKSAK